MRTVQLTFVTKPGCHLCDDARVVLQGVLESDALRHAEVEVSVTERNILDDETLAKTYAEEIPVVLINGRMHSYWHLDPQRLTKALIES